MIILKNISKFYNNNGNINSAINKINLELNLNEFVVITGESGSGKSTLLNIISCLDNYDEGEMYIFDEDISNYSKTDLEKYRKKYISNIFQNFNLINSYTVYENIELVYLLNGYKKNKIKDKVNNILNKINLMDYKNTKVSKLSGGQKQKVAIGRALAKETPIIVADEPTGNLDSKSGNEILQILHEISANKLVIVVTHNYDQIEKYATRKIKMSDGKIVENYYINSKNYSTVDVKKNTSNIKLFEKFLLAKKNAFNIFSKFILLFLIYLFLSVSVLSLYLSFVKKDNSVNTNGFNQFFQDYTGKRIVVNKKNNGKISEVDLNKLLDLDNIDHIIKEDLLLDKEYLLESSDYNLFFNALNIDTLKKVDIGDLPKQNNEIVIEVFKDNYYISNYKEIFSKQYVIKNEENIIESNIKIVGIKFKENYDNYAKVYLNKEILDKLNMNIYSEFSNTKIKIGNNIIDSENENVKIVPLNSLNKGEVIITDNYSYMCNNYNCKDEKLSLDIMNKYFNSSTNLIIKNIITERNYKEKLNLENYSLNNFYISMDDYIELYNKGNYQNSIFINNEKKVDETISKLNLLGYNTLYIKDTIVDFDQIFRNILNIFILIGIIIVLTGLFFISYFIIKLILKARNKYFTIIRILGASYKDVISLLFLELNLILSISFLFVIFIIELIKNKVLTLDYLNNLIVYLNISDFVILYLILLLINILITIRFTKNIFTKSIIESYNEEV